MKDDAQSARSQPSHRQRDAGIIIGVSILLAMLALIGFAATIPG